MRVTHLALEDFRSYDRTDLDLAPGITAFVGPNGAGKTNLLEAIHLLARGDSPRARDDAEIVRWGAAMGRASADLADGDDRTARIEAMVFAPTAGERRRPRRYLVDGAPKRPDEVLGRIVVVAFFPEDVELLSQAPAARRRYLDAMIAQVDRRHRAETREYQRVLEQRNALLRAFREEQAVSEEELRFWDGELCRLAAAISRRRIGAVHDLRAPFREAMDRWGGPHLVDVAYATAAEGDTDAQRSAAYGRLIEEKREKEMWQGATLVGPHREDLAVTSGGRDLPSFASRGEHRSVVLALKLAEAAWLRERTGTAPIFLLDDVLSELDAQRRQHLVEALPPDAQALVTSALPAGLPAGLSKTATIVPVAR
jgi:DNA replication and repair protein RecF